MKDLRLLNHFRDRQWERMIAARNGAAVDPELEPYGGCFRVPSLVDRSELRIIASRWSGLIGADHDPPWDHASVSRNDRCPTWEEMEQVKRLFWDRDAVCMQLHVAESDHISVHPYCLHIWQPRAANIPLPPSGMVA